MLPETLVNFAIERGPSQIIREKSTHKNEAHDTVKKLV